MSPCGVGIATAFVIESEGDFCPGKGGFTRLALCATVQEPALWMHRGHHTAMTFRPGTPSEEQLYAWVAGTLPRQTRTVESALQVIQPQHTVVIGMNGNIPASLCQALGARLAQWPDLHILGAGALQQFPFQASYTVHDMFITMATRPQPSPVFDTLLPSCTVRLRITMARV